MLRRVPNHVRFAIKQFATITVKVSWWIKSRTGGSGFLTRACRRPIGQKAGVSLDVDWRIWIFNTASRGVFPAIFLPRQARKTFMLHSFI